MTSCRGKEGQRDANTIQICFDKRTYMENCCRSLITKLVRTSTAGVAQKLLPQLYFCVSYFICHMEISPVER